MQQTTSGTGRLVLRPGAPVMARSPGVLQVGLDEPTVRLPDQPEVRRLLTRLGRPGGAPADAGEHPAAVTHALAALTAAGLLVPLPADERPATDPRALALRAQFGPDAVRRHAARTAATVAVRADPAVAPGVVSLLESAGLRTADDPAEAAVLLVVSTGPVARESLDPLVRATVPHLLVTGAAAGVRVGPFVDPGRTACLRCVDAHEAEHDPRRPLLLVQAAALAAERPPPRDALLDRLVLAWAVRDLTRYLEGDEPSTWSTTVDVGPTEAPRTVRWGRHPYCGCSWDAVIELP